MHRIVIGRLKFQHQRTLHFLSLSIIMVYVLKCNNNYVSTGWYRGFALKNPNIKVKTVIYNYNYKIYFLLKMII